MSSTEDLIGEKVRVSTSGPNIACEVVKPDGEEGGEMNYIVEDLHTGNQFPIREQAISIPDEGEFEDTLYVWQNRDFDKGEWVTKATSREREEVESQKSQEWSSTGAGGTRIKEETITLS